MGFYDRMKEARLRTKVGDKPTYKVLQADMISPAEKERVASIASYVRTGDEAHKLAGHDGFAYKGLDLRGRCGVVVFRGKEVALLFKREIVEIEPGPSDPVPESQILEPSEAWIQIDLLSIEKHVQQSGLADKLRTAFKTIDGLRILRAQDVKDKKAAEEKLEKLEKERMELKALRDKVERYEKTISEQILEVEVLQRQLGDEKRGRKADLIRVVEELFPVFNTVWLAGVHRVKDTLYGMLQKQLVDALGKVNVQLIEPAVGDEFNPALHHAVHAVQLPSGSREINTVVQISRVGWSFNTQVISAAEVIVGVEKEPEPLTISELSGSIDFPAVEAVQEDLQTQTEQKEKQEGV